MPANQPPLVAAVTKQQPRRVWVISVGVILLAGGAALGTWRWQRRASFGTHSAPILSKPFKSTKLSSGGRSHALITPDGQYVAYTSESGGKESIWLRQLANSESIQIVPPTEVRYLGLAISHDGNSIYFVRNDRGEVKSVMYRVMTVGGIPVKITEQTQGWISVSPDDQMIAFVRCQFRPNDYCSLFVIGNDGRNERKILTRPGPTRITASQFAPDGKSIVFASGQSFNGSRDFHLFRVDLSSGVESEVSPTAFFVVNHLESLPSDNGFLFTAQEMLDGKSRLWQVLVNGKTRALTNDSTDYDEISLSKAGDRMVATHVSNSFQLHVAALSDVGNPKVLIAARSIAFAPDGRLVYASDDGDLWIIDRDGTNQRQLTSNAFTDFSPRVSPDGRYIFFASNRAGSNQIWRMNIDGSVQIQITHGEGGYPEMVSADGKYVYFQSGLHQTLWQAAVDGGQETLLWEKSVMAPAFSPDGTLVGFCFRDAERRLKIAIIAIESHRILNTFALNAEYTDVIKMAWAHDAKSVIYLAANGAGTYLREQSLDGAAPSLIADLGSDEIEDLALSPDGRTLAFTRGKWIHSAILIEGLK